LFSDEERAYTILLEYVSGQQLKCLRALAEMGGAASLGGAFPTSTGIPLPGAAGRIEQVDLPTMVDAAAGPQIVVVAAAPRAWIQGGRQRLPLQQIPGDRMPDGAPLSGELPLQYGGRCHTRSQLLEVKAVRDSLPVQIPAVAERPGQSIIDYRATFH
jgi:hypothetical protein